MILIDHNLLSAEVLRAKYTSKYNTIPASSLNATGQLVCDLFNQPLAPLTVLAQDGYFQKVFTAFVYIGKEDKEHHISWVSGVDFLLDKAEFNYSLGNFRTDAEIVNGEVTKVVVLTIDGNEIVFPFKAENPLEGKGERAAKLSALDEGGVYKLEGVKTVSLVFEGVAVIKTLVRVSGKEYWSNKQLDQFLHISGLIPATINEWKTLDITLRVIKKDTTKAGHQFVRIGLE